MGGVQIEYLVGLFLVGISLDKPKDNVGKIIGGVVLIAAAALGLTLVS